MSSDRIPVGSPPVPPGRHAAPGGWYPDPAQAGQERYWDGWQWSRSVREAQGSTPAAPARSAGPQSSGFGGQRGGFGGQPGNPHGGQPYGGQPGAGHPGGVAHGPLTSDGVPLASWGKRALAALIDLVAVWLITQIVIGIYNSVTGAGVRIQAALNAYMAYLVENIDNPEAIDFNHALSILLTRDLYIQMAITLVLAIAYYAVFHATISATLGKLATGLRVVPTDRGTEIQGLDWGRALVRAALFEAFGRFLLLVQLVNLLWPLWDSKRQTLHDKAAGTQVVRIK